MIIKNWLPLLILTLIITLGFAVRIYQLSDIPHGFFADEASIGYNAHTILTQGKDEYGVPYPLFFKAFGEYKSPIQIYSTAPFIAIFGLNEFSIRLVSVIYGTLTIAAIYFLTKALFKTYHSETIALLASFFLTISPWHIHFSRVAFELMPFVFFTTFGSYLFIKAQKNSKLFLVSIFTFILALYSYFPARIFIPLLGLSFSFVYLKSFLNNKKIVFFSIALLLILLIPLLQSMFLGGGWARWQQVNIFTQPPTDQTVAGHIFNNYLSHFSPNFLFLKGDIDMPGQFISRHSVKGLGELYLFQLPLILLGLYKLFRYRQAFFILILWLIFYPVGSIFTTDQSAQATRSIIGVVPFQIVTALGLVFLLELFKEKIAKYMIAGAFVAVALFSILPYLNQYFILYPLHSSGYWGWQYGPKEIMKYFLTSKDSYDDLYMSGEFNAVEIFLKFYDPKDDCHNKCRIGDLWRNPEIHNPARKQLFALSPEYLQNSEFKDKFSVKQIIYYPNQDPAFFIGEVMTNEISYAKLPEGI